MAEAAKATNGNGKATGSSVPAERKEMAVQSQAFMNSVIREMSSVSESVQMTPYQKKLAEHLFIHVDTVLKELEAKRIKNGETKKMPIIWANVNMSKLALSAMYRIELELDALVPNTIDPIPYWNGKLEKYDLDLRIGYDGLEYYKRRFALEPPKDVIYELVYATDEFVVYKKGLDRDVETYEFKIKDPFNRGEVVGGFGYLIYEDATKNRLITVDKKEFERTKKAGNSGGAFWKDWEDRMQWKTIKRRTLKHVKVDPAKVNQAYLVAEADMIDRQEAEEEIRKEANTGKVIDITEEKKELAESTQTQTAAAEQSQAEPEASQEQEQPEPPAPAEEQKRKPGF
jgi:recombination protein RecT